MSNEYEKFIQSLSAGDEYPASVPLSRWHSDDSHALLTVRIIRTTKTQIIATVGGVERRYGIGSGRRIGGWSFETLPGKASKEEITKLYHESNSRKLTQVESYDWEKLPPDMLRDLLAKIEEKKS